MSSICTCRHDTIHRLARVLDSTDKRNAELQEEVKGLEAKLADNEMKASRENEYLHWLLRECPRSQFPIEAIAEILSLVKGGLLGLDESGASIISSLGLSQEHEAALRERIDWSIQHRISGESRVSTRSSSRSSRSSSKQINIFTRLT